MNIPVNSFFKKSDAVQYYKKYCNNNELKLFAEDITDKGNKRYYVMKSNELFNKLTICEYSSYYEFWTNTTNLKFALDIDIPFNEIQNYSPGIANQVISELIMFSKQLESFGETNNMPDIENIAQSLSGDAAKIKYRLTLS